MIQHRQEGRVKVKFSLIDDETPKIEDCLRQIEGKLDLFCGLGDVYHRKRPYREIGNPENMTLNFPVGFCYKRKKREK